MPISLATLRDASIRRPRLVAGSLQEARTRGARTAFLCHSHRDKEIVVGFVNILAESGWNVYVDWEDPGMPSQPSRNTATRIKERIKAANFFLFLATRNSMDSRWCPWEIGYADGTKPIDSILVCPTAEGATTHGSEYLDLYRSIDMTREGKLGAWPPGEPSRGVLLESV